MISPLAARLLPELDQAAEHAEPARTMDHILRRMAAPPEPVDNDAMPAAVPDWEAEQGKRWPGRRS